MLEKLPPSEIEIPVEQLLQTVARQYDLGNVYSWKLASQGVHDDAVFKLTTAQGVFALKVHSRYKTREVVENEVIGLTKFLEGGIPVPKIINHQGSFICEIKIEQHPILLHLTEYFDGQDFITRPPTQDDFLVLAWYLANIHNQSFKVHKAEQGYWTSGIADLPALFEMKKPMLSQIDINLIGSIAQRFSDLRLSRFTRSIIHGDFNRTNALRNSTGEYCIIDLGCIDFNIALIDLAVFLAWFLDIPTSEPVAWQMYNLALNEYARISKIRSAELKYLPLFIQAVYAMYILDCGYSTEEWMSTDGTIQKWLDFSRKSMVGSQVWLKIMDSWSGQPPGHRV